MADGFARMAHFVVHSDGIFEILPALFPFSRLQKLLIVNSYAMWLLPPVQSL